MRWKLILIFSGLCTVLFFLSHSSSRNRAAAACSANNHLCSDPSPSLTPTYPAYPAHGPSNTDNATAARALHHPDPGHHRLGSIALDPKSLNVFDKNPSILLPIRSGKTIAKLDNGRPLSSDGSGWQWKGTLAGYPYSSVVLTHWKGATQGSIHGADGGIYEIRQAASGQLEIIWVDTSTLPPCQTDADHVVSTEEDTEASNHPQTAHDGVTTSFFDIVVAYNEAARQWAGGNISDPGDVADVEARILTAVGELNTAFSNSNVDAEMRLAWMGLIDYPYPETENFNRALSEIQDPNDGNADLLAEKKSEYAADYASLWITSDSSGGLGYVLENASQKDFAFNVVRVENPTSTFAHECGHNFGNLHIRSSYRILRDSWDPYSYAHRFNGTSSGTPQYGTVLCSLGDLTSSSNRILYFSNPNVTIDGTAAGVANSEDVSRTLRENRAVFEDFYHTPARTARISNNGTNAFTILQGFGFVGESYSLFRTTDLSSAPATWTSLGTFHSDSNGTASADDTPTGLDSAFYQFR